MSLGSEIAPHLPHLRRFARALSGSQEGGDSYVEAALRAVIADSSVLDLSDGGRVGCYRLLLQIWTSVSVNNRAEPSVSEDTRTAADRRVQMLTPISRQAFLLTSVEGFDAAEAAAILGLTGAEVGALIARAAEEITDQVATSVMIIEDEPIIALDLEALVEELGHRVTGVARTHAEAVKLAARETPGLLLADIQLADGSSGIDAVNELLKSFSVPVIFITAYPERLLTGQRPEPTFLITKPFDESMVRAVISQALFFQTDASSAAA